MLIKFLGGGIRFLAYVLFACWLTWPVVLGSARYLPLGSRPPATVPLFNLWTFLWNSDRLHAVYQDYWQAPIFHPTPGAFALSDPQPLTGLVFAAILPLTGNPVLTYNVLLLLVITLNGVMARRLARQLEVPPAPAFLTGLLAQGLPFVADEIGVFQMTVLFPIFWAFTALDAFMRTGGLRSALTLGLTFAATYLTSGYYGLFLGLFLPLGGLLLMRRPSLTWSFTRNLLFGVLLAALLVGPIAVMQGRWAAGYSWRPDYVQTLSAQGLDYLRLGWRCWGTPGMPWLQPMRAEAWPLYPGTALLFLAGLGIVTGLRGPWRRWVLFCWIGAALAVLLSFGLNLRIVNWHPYEFLRGHLPGFDKLRSPYRAGAFAQVFLVVLAGFGLSSLWQWRGLLGRCLAVPIVCVGLLEVVAVPTPMYRVLDTLAQGGWIDWLADQPRGAVAMVPFAATREEPDYHATVVGMLQQRGHGQPLANGYSGFFPQPAVELQRAMRNFPDGPSLELLRAADITYLVIDRRWLTPERLTAIQAFAEQLEPRLTDESKAIYSLK